MNARLWTYRTVVFWRRLEPTAAKNCLPSPALTCAMKSPTRRLNSSGSSMLMAWPQLGITDRAAVGMFCFISIHEENWHVVDAREISAESGSMLWRRVDVPGHDACRLDQRESGYHLRGAAVFCHQAGPANISYSIACDARWRTQSGQIMGFIGERRLDPQWRASAGVESSLRSGSRLYARD
jgi:Putative glycolipid-binding